MSCNRHYDTVAFDVRDDATMLFFARTTRSGEIEDYLLLMRPDGDKFDGGIYVEVNESQVGGQDLISKVHLSGNVMTIELTEPVTAFEGASEITLTYDDSPENRASIETGAFRVFGDMLVGGNA